MVHQEISVVPVMTVAQYMFLGREKKKGLFVDDRITVIKDGRYVTTLDGKTTGKDELIRLLAGRDIVSAKKTANTELKNAPIVLEVKNLRMRSMPSDVSFSLRQGEILGLTGLMGSGRTETAKAICASVASAPDIYYMAKKISII